MFKLLRVTISLTIVILSNALISGYASGVETPNAQQLFRELCHSHSYHEGLELTGVAEWKSAKSIGTAYNRRLLLRYRQGYAPDGVRLPPSSTESLIENPGEPHLREDLISHWWVAYDSSGLLGAYDRGFITGYPDHSPRRRWSDVLLSRERRYHYKYAFFDHLLHTSPHGRLNVDIFGDLHSVMSNLECSVSPKGTFSGLPVFDLKAVYPQEDGTERGATLRVVVGEYPIILSAVELHGGVHPDHFGTLFRREVGSLVSSEGYLIPTGVRWSSATTDLSFSFDVEKIGRIGRNLEGLWEFDSPTGTRFVTDQSCEMRSYRVSFSDSDEEAIRAYLFSRGVKIDEHAYFTRVTLIVVTSVALMGLVLMLLRYQRKPS